MHGWTAPGEHALDSAVFPVRDYSLAATLDSGQAFRWTPQGDAWAGIIGRRWVRLSALKGAVRAWTPAPSDQWHWLTDYLQLNVDLEAIITTFPLDGSLQTAVRACRGLRLLRQDPWECLASFLLSSTKQITQIRQIIHMLCERLGEPIANPPANPPVYAFPRPEQIAAAGERRLRECRMGFRASHLLVAARTIAEGKLDLPALSRTSLEEARARLMTLPGVGPKIADCVLLFSCDQPRAFPVDVWIARALRAVYPRYCRSSLAQLREFASQHFGPQAGYAQQYLFHYARLHRAFSG